MFLESYGNFDATNTVTLTPARYKNHIEIYRSNVNKRPIWYKT